jgi:hypothetical protein
VVIAWVFFRADSFTAATRILGRMFSFEGWGELLLRGYPTDGVLAVVARLQTGVSGSTGYIPMVVLGALLAALLLPNTQAIFCSWIHRLYGTELDIYPTADARFPWKPARSWVVAAGLMLAASILAISKGSSPFLYFNF